MVASIDEDMIPTEIWEICNHLTSHKKQVYLVGGSIRDLIIGETTPEDWDIATDSIPSDTIQIFQDKYRVIPTGLPHGTVTVLVNGRPIEVTTFRVEGGYHDGRHPSHVEFVEDINQDLARRDLTCNAIAYHPYKKQLLDPFNGINDIKAQLLRMVGDPHDRLEEDGLRALRVFRFVSQLGFEIHSETLIAIPDHFSTFAKVAAERTHSELDRLMSGPHWKQALASLEKSDLFYEIFPDLRHPKLKNVLEEISRDRNSLTFKILEALPEQSPVRLRYAVLFHQFSSVVQNTSLIFPICNKNYISRLLRDLRFSKKVTSEILHLLTIHLTKFSFDLTKDRPFIEYHIRKLLHRVRPEYLREYLWFNRAKDLAIGGESKITGNISTEIERLATKNPPIELSDLVLKGDDITEQLALDKQDASQREIIGQILTLLRERVEFQPDLNTMGNLNAILKNIRPIVIRCQQKNPELVRLLATDHIRKIYTNNNPTYLAWENHHTYMLSRWLSMCVLRRNRRVIVIFDGTNLNLPSHQNHRESLAIQFRRYNPFFINLTATEEQAFKNFQFRKRNKTVILSSDANMAVFEKFSDLIDKNPDSLVIPSRCQGANLNTYELTFKENLLSIVKTIRDENHRMIILGGNVLSGKTHTALVLKKLMEKRE